MKVTLTFDLADESDRTKFQDAMSATELRLGVEAFYEECLRSLRKYGVINGEQIDKMDIYDVVDHIIEHYNNHIGECL